ncbi:lipopolysaccharide biosynthesis protein [Candidatus Harpocratesius sp.]
MIGRKSLFVLISRTTTRLLQSFLFLIAVNYFLPDEFGYQKIAISLMGFFVFFSALGLEKPYIKVLAEKEKSERNDVFTTFFITKMGLTIISSGITIILFFWQVKSDLIPSDRELTRIFFILFIKFFIYSINMVYNLSFRAELNVVKTEIPNLVGGILGIAFSLASVFLFHDFLLFLAGQTLTELIKFGMFLFMKNDFVFTRFKPVLFKRLFLLNFIFLLPIGVNTLKTNLGPFFFLQYFDNELLGVYSVIANLFLLLRELQKTLGFLLIPNFTKLIKQEDFNRINRQINRFEKYLLVLNGSIIIGGILLAENFLTIFLGDIYFEKGLIFFYGSLLYLFNFPMMGAYTHLLIAAEKMKTYTIYTLSLFLSSLFCWIFLIKDLNIIALDLGNWVAGMVGTIIIRFYTQKQLYVGKMEKPQVKNLIILIIFIFVSFLSTKFSHSLLVSIILTSILIILYIFVLFAFHILGKEDIRYIIDVVFPKNIANSLKNDIFKDFLID